MDDLRDLSIRELLARCLAEPRDERAWVELVRRTEEICARVIYKRLLRGTRSQPTQEVLKDTLQEVLKKLIDKDLKALRDLRLDHDGSFTAFVTTVAANAVLDYMRKPSSNKEVQLDPEIDPAGPGPTTRESKIQVDQCDDCVRTQCAAREYEIFRLHYRYGYAAREIAELPAIGMKTKEVEYVLWRIVRLLREKFGRPPGGEAGSHPQDDD